MSDTPNSSQTKRSLRSNKTNLYSNDNNKPVQNHNRTTAAATKLHNKQTPTQLVITPTAKRKSSNISPPSLDIVQSAKKTTHEMANGQFTFDDIKKLFESQSNSMASNMQSALDAHTNKMVNEIQTQLENHTSQISNTITTAVQKEVNLLGEQLKADIRNQVANINNKIDQIQTNFNSEVATVKKSVEVCWDRINSSEADVLRFAKLNELKIKGIPYAIDENLSETFTAISQYIGYDLSIPNHLANLNRIQTRNRDTNELTQQPTIIVKFVAKFIRDAFYSLYLNKVSEKPLMSEHINLAQGSRVIISENLTTANQILFVSAMKHKIDKKVSQSIYKRWTGAS